MAELEVRLFKESDFPLLAEVKFRAVSRALRRHDSFANDIAHGELYLSGNKGDVQAALVQDFHDFGPRYHSQDATLPTMYVAEKDSAPVGYAAVTAMVDRRMLIINDVNVDPAIQHEGVAATLLQEAAAKLSPQYGLQFVSLEVSQQVLLNLQERQPNHPIFRVVSKTTPEDYLTESRRKRNILLNIGIFSDILRQIRRQTMQPPQE